MFTGTLWISRWQVRLLGWLDHVGSSLHQSHPEPPAVQDYRQGAAELSDAAVLMAELNHYRLESGLARLTVEPWLLDLASANARLLASLYAHDRHHGQAEALTDVVSLLTERACQEDVSQLTCCECEGMNALDSWLGSPADRAILTDPRSQRIGCALIRTRDGTPYWCLLITSPQIKPFRPGAG